MRSDTIPLVVPEELHQEIRYTADLTQLSQADVMRQSMKLGLPRLREQLEAEQTIRPLTKQEARAAFGPDPEWDSLEMAMAGRLMSPPEDD